MMAAIHSMHSLLSLVVAVVAVGILVTTAPVHSYVVGDHHHQNHNGHNNNNILSRFDFQSKIIMIVGRTPNTEMPLEWAASGAKLALPLHVRFSTNECQSYEMNQESLLLADSRGGGAASSFLSVLPLNEPSFVSIKGQESVKVTPGAFSCQIQIPDTEQYSFRFFLDFPEGATRNDVVLPPGRVFFMTACWNGDSNLMQRAKRIKDNHTLSIRDIDVELVAIGQTKSLSKTSRYFNLLDHRNSLLSQINMLDEAFPPEDRLVKGPNNIIFLREGVIAVKRHIGRAEKFHWVGTFTLGDFRE